MNFTKSQTPELSSVLCQTFSQFLRSWIGTLMSLTPWSQITTVPPPPPCRARCTPVCPASPVERFATSIRQDARLVFSTSHPQLCSIPPRGGGGGWRRNMRREERVTVQGPVKKQQPDGMSHRGLADPPPFRPPKSWDTTVRNFRFGLGTSALKEPNCFLGVQKGVKFIFAPCV